MSGLQEAVATTKRERERSECGERNSVIESISKKHTRHTRLDPRLSGDTGRKLVGTKNCRFCRGGLRRFVLDRHASFGTTDARVVRGSHWLGDMGLPCITLDPPAACRRRLAHIQTALGLLCTTSDDTAARSTPSSSLWRTHPTASACSDEYHRLLRIRSRSTSQFLRFFGHC